MRKVAFAEGEIYHIFNRGVDKRKVFEDGSDLERFLLSMMVFNTKEPVGSIYEHLYECKKKKGKSKFGRATSKKGELVEFVAYCLNPNHYHLLLKEIAEKGIERFMKKLGNGYTKYFNNRHKRNGVLFQGPFQAVHVNSNTQLLHVSVYINLNNRFKKRALNLSRSSWEEYVGLESNGICKKEIILGQFKSKQSYLDFAKSSLKDIINRKNKEKELENPNLDMPRPKKSKKLIQ